MVPIHRWQEDPTGLSWYRGFYLPVPVDPNARTLLGYDTHPEVQAYITKHPEQFSPLTKDHPSETSSGQTTTPKTT